MQIRGGLIFLFAVHLEILNRIIAMKLDGTHLEDKQPQESCSSQQAPVYDTLSTSRYPHHHLCTIQLSPLVLCSNIQGQATLFHFHLHLQ